MAISRLFARPLLSSIFLYAGYHAVRNPEPMKEQARRISERVVPLVKSRGVPIPEDPATLVRLNGAVQVLAGTALALGKAPRLSATLLGVSLVPTTLAGHSFWLESDPETRAKQKVQAAKNASLLGGLMLAALDTEGKPGVAWRAKRAARDVRRQTQHLAHDAKLEARLAAKSLR